MALLFCAAAGVSAAAIGTAQPAERAPEPASAAEAFPASDGVVDLMISGPAAKALYDRLPGKGEEQACGATGLHKGDRRISCVSRDGEHVCHLWLDVPKQALTEPETDDC